MTLSHCGSQHSLKAAVSSTLEEEAERLSAIYGNKETEKNWQLMDESIKLMTGMCTTASEEEIERALWKCQAGLTGALQTERTRLALSAMDLVQTAACRLREKFEALYDVYLGCF